MKCSLKESRNKQKFALRVRLKGRVVHVKQLPANHVRITSSDCVAECTAIVKTNVAWVSTHCATGSARGPKSYKDFDLWVPTWFVELDHLWRPQCGLDRYEFLTQGVAEYERQAVEASSAP